MSDPRLDIPDQQPEPAPAPSCASCLFAETDRDDGKLYCHEGLVKAQPVIIMRAPQDKTPVIAQLGSRPPARPEVEVLGVVSYWPEVQQHWVCWRHPHLQTERRRMENAIYGL
jgi:hypothetical protein